MLIYCEKSFLDVAYGKRFRAGQDHLDRGGKATGIRFPDAQNQTHICNAAARRGQLYFMEWCRENGFGWANDFAARSGYIEVMRWCHENGCPQRVTRQRPELTWRCFSICVINDMNGTRSPFTLQPASMPLHGRWKTAALEATAPTRLPFAGGHQMVKDGCLETAFLKPRT